MFKVGDKVVLKPGAKHKSIDEWGRGDGIGTVVESPFDLSDAKAVDVKWPAGRCFEYIHDLLLYIETERAIPNDKCTNQSSTINGNTNPSTTECGILL